MNTKTRRKSAAQSEISFRPLGITTKLLGLDHPNYPILTEEQGGNFLTGIRRPHNNPAVLA